MPAATLVDAEAAREFMRVTGAAAILGYKIRVDWIRSTAFELFFFDACTNFTLTTRGLHALENKITKQYVAIKKKMQFTMVINKTRLGCH